LLGVAQGKYHPELYDDLEGVQRKVKKLHHAVLLGRFRRLFESFLKFVARLNIADEDKHLKRNVERNISCLHTDQLICVFGFASHKAVDDVSHNTAKHEQHKTCFVELRVL
jgi:hypothetical protein